MEVPYKIGEFVKPNPKTKKAPKVYKSKNRNVEYYYDANGDIKRRKLATK